eukprot:3931824-Rhodomonas_salina.1
MQHFLGVGPGVSSYAKGVCAALGAPRLGSGWTHQEETAGDMTPHPHFKLEGGASLGTGNREQGEGENRAPGARDDGRGKGLRGRRAKDWHWHYLTFSACDEL